MQTVGANTYLVIHLSVIDAVKLKRDDNSP